MGTLNKEQFLSLKKQLKSIIPTNKIEKEYKSILLDMLIWETDWNAGYDVIQELVNDMDYEKRSYLESEVPLTLDTLKQFILKFKLPQPKWPNELKEMAEREKLIKLVRLIEQKSGKKLTFVEPVKTKTVMKEAIQPNEAKGNAIAEKLQNVTTGLEAIKTALGKKSAKQAWDAVTGVEKMISEVIADVTAADNVTSQTPISEDVDMDIDQITTEPDTVKKLTDKKININLVDKNDRNNSSSSSSSSSSSVTY